MPIKIVTDSACDLPEDIVAQYGITVVPLYINLADRGYLDGIEITREEFYRQLPDYNPPPTTAAPSPEKFCQVYDGLAAQGATEILSIHMSISLSATVDTARLCAAEKRSIPVTVFDSGQLSLGTGFLVVRAAQAAAKGRPMQDILALLEEQTSRTHVFAALDTLEYLKRSGRMNGAVAGIGELLQIKPLLKMHNGNPTVERVRTNNGATRRLVELLSALTPLEQVAVVHTHAPDRADYVRRQAERLLPAGNILSVDITPVIGANIGPGAVGFAVVTARKS